MPLYRSTFRILIAAGILAFSVPALANEYAPIAELGVNFHTGKTGSSLTGALGYFLAFRAEVRKGFLRWYAATELQSDVGKASIGSETPAATVYGAAFEPGVNLFPFQDARFEPYIGGGPVLGWDMLKMGSPPSGVEAETESLAYGYEISAGVDIRTGNLEGNAVRIRSGYWAVSGSLAGISGFQLNGFRLTVGLVW